MKKESKNIQYKQRNILVWNEVAPYYHKRWAREEVGPFNVTNELIKLSKIKSGDCVLDLACGTGLVTKKITRKVGKNGIIYAIDTSKTAINIAKKWVGMKENLHFIIADAETIQFNTTLNKNSATAKITIDRTKFDVKYGSGSFFDGLGDNMIYDEFVLNIDLSF